MGKERIEMISMAGMGMMASGGIYTSTIDRIC